MSSSESSSRASSFLLFASVRYYPILLTLSSMKSSGNDNFLIILITLCVAIGAFLGIILPYQDMQAFQVFRIVFGSIFILFLPGYHVTRVFFGNKEIDMLERFALSFALSISVIPLLTFYAHLLGLPIASLTVYGITLSVILLSML